MDYDYVIHTSLLVISTISNSAALFTAYKRRPLKPMDILMLHSSVCGFLFFITIALKREIAVLYTNLIFYAINWFFGLDRVLMLVLLAGQRFLAVYLPLKAKLLLTKRRTYISMLIVYIFSLGKVCTVSAAAALGVIKRERSSRAFILVFAGNSLLMMLCYLAIFIRLYRLKREGRKKKMRPYLFCFFITVSNLVSTIPMIVWIYGIKTDYVPRYLVWLDSIFNPLLYITKAQGSLIKRVIRVICNAKSRQSIGSNVDEIEN